MNDPRHPVDQEVRDLTRRVGDRVRAARKDCRLSRRELSEHSQVSQRYLAQVEGGEGNISIALLLKVGRALNRPISWFLEPDANAGDQGVADRFNAADPDTQRAILALLDAEAATSSRPRKFALIGLRGAGKSTLGSRAAQQLGLRFIELNDMVEQAAGMPVAEVMALYGQEGYRALEHRALSQAAISGERIILAVAGGIVGSPETFDLLLTRFQTIWLKASAQEHMDRVRAQGDERPMAGNPAAMEELKSILSGRETQYARAEQTLDTSGRGEAETLADLVELLTQKA